MQAGSHRVDPREGPHVRMVREAGLEPARAEAHKILSRMPPLAQSSLSTRYHTNGRLSSSLVFMGGFEMFQKVGGHNPGHSRMETQLARRLYDVKQAGVFLGVSDWTVRELIWRGDLSHVRVGRLIRLDMRDLEAFIAKNRSEGPV